MIPSTVGFLDKDFEIEVRPSLTYQMEMDSHRIRGYTDGLEAVRQAVYKIIMTERYQYIMYSWNYGIELQDLFGEPVTYVCPELKRRISRPCCGMNGSEAWTTLHLIFRKKGLFMWNFWSIPYSGT